MRTVIRRGYQAEAPEPAPVREATYASHREFQRQGAPESEATHAGGAETIEDAQDDPDAA